MLLSELGVAHPLSIGFEVVGFGPNLVRNFGIGGMDRADRERQFFGSVATRETLGFDIVTFYAEDATGTVPTTPFPGSRDRIVRSIVLAVLPHFT